MIFFFAYYGDVVHHEFVTQRQKVNKKHHLTVLRRLHEAIRRKRADLWAENA